MSKYQLVFEKNIARVESLSEIYIAIKDGEQKGGKEYKLTDILRSEVVFLHSSFEEYFRSVLVQWLPIKASEETLRQIPISVNAGKRPDKLYLNDIAKFRGKSVDEIINESVEEHLKLQSFNNQGEIRAWCTKIGIDLSTFGKLGDIDKAVHRRHKIVHEADTNKNNDIERLQAIKPGDITPWIKAYKDLVTLIDEYVSKWEEEECHA